MCAVIGCQKWETYTATNTARRRRRWPVFPNRLFVTPAPVSYNGTLTILHTDA